MGLCQLWHSPISLYYQLSSIDSSASAQKQRIDSGKRKDTVMRPQPDSLSVYKVLLNVNRRLLAVDGYRNLATAENREPLELQPIHRHTGHNIASYVLGPILLAVTIKNGIGYFCIIGSIGIGEHNICRALVVDTLKLNLSRSCECAHYEQ